jgi:small subunit ribosomal protein S3
MSHKVDPISNRLGIIKDWNSRWFNKKKRADYLREDSLIRDFIKKKLAKAAIERVIIERSANLINIIVYSARPGIIIGRGGTGVEELKKEIKKKIQEKSEVRLDIKEIRKSEVSAVLVGQNIAEQLEKRMPFRRVLKKSIDQVSQNKNVKGVKIAVKGRLGGTEMARREWLKDGRIPLQTLRADIDFAKINAYTTYGVIGIKVWIYKEQSDSEADKK